MPKFKLVVAFDSDKIIGKKGSEKLLWHIPEDLAHFKNLTEGQVVLMGKSTFEILPSFAKPLPNRVNLVLSRTDHGEKTERYLATWTTYWPWQANMHKTVKSFL